MTEFTAETVGLSLTDGKTLLQAVQQQVVEAQMWEMAGPYRLCPRVRQLKADFRGFALRLPVSMRFFRRSHAKSCGGTFWRILEAVDVLRAAAKVAACLSRSQLLVVVATSSS